MSVRIEGSGSHQRGFIGGVGDRVRRIGEAVERVVSSIRPPTEIFVSPSFPDKSEQATIERVTTLDPYSLQQILKDAYGPVDWKSKDKTYWRGKWEYRHQNFSSIKDKWSLEVRKTYEYLHKIIEWTCDSETRGHLDPPPGIPKYDEVGHVVGYRTPDLHDPLEVDCAIADLARYYYNYGEPKRITPLIALNKDERIIAARTIRWRGDPYVPEGERIASMERFIVDPELRHLGIGRVFTATAIEYIFKKEYYSGMSAREIRVWVMQDDKAGDWKKNWYFFRGLGFQTVIPTAERPAHWPEYAEKRGIPTVRGDAMWLRLRPEWYQERKLKDSRIKPCETVDIN